MRPPTIFQHEHSVQVAGHSQIQNLQLAVLRVLHLVFLVRQWHALLLQIAAGTNEDAVVIAPGGKAQPMVLLQILDREQDVCAFLNDLAEQPLQGAVALVQHAGRVQDGAVDAAALEDADILQLCAVGGEQVVCIDLQRINAAQLLNSLPTGHDCAHSRSRTLQP